MSYKIYKTMEEVVEDCMSIRKHQVFMTDEEYEWWKTNRPTKRFKQKG